MGRARHRRCAATSDGSGCFGDSALRDSSSVWVRRASVSYGPPSASGAPAGGSALWRARAAGRQAQSIACTLCQARGCRQRDSNRLRALVLEGGRFGVHPSPSRVWRHRLRSTSGQGGCLPAHRFELAVRRLPPFDAAGHSGSPADLPRFRPRSAANAPWRPPCGVPQHVGGSGIPAGRRG